MTGPAALVVGEALVDIFVTSDTRELVPGGGPLNVAIGLAQLGVPTSLVTTLGDDGPGRQIARHLHERQVELIDTRPRAARPPATRTSSATCSVNEHGTATYDFDVSWELGTIPAGESAALVHTGSIAAFLEPGASDVRRWYTASSTALRSFDPNIRPALVGSKTAARETVLAFAAQSDIIKLSDEDASWLFPHLGDDELARLLDPEQRRVVVLTRGQKGCSAWANGNRFDRAAPVVRLVDTVGAGDSFMAGLLAALSQRPDAAAARRSFRSDDVERALRTALLCAALTVSRRGAYAPSVTDLDGFLESEDAHTGA